MQHFISWCEAPYHVAKRQFMARSAISFTFDIFCESGLITAEEFDEMKEYCGKIRRMLISSITTAKKNSTERNQTNEA